MVIVSQEEGGVVEVDIRQFNQEGGVGVRDGVKGVVLPPTRWVYLRSITDEITEKLKNYKENEKRWHIGQDV